MEIKWSQMIMTLINLVILVVILKHFFWDKIKKVIDEREEYIESSLAQAEEESRKARLYLVENERILNNAKKEGKKIIEKKKEKANRVYDEIIQDANKEASIIKERAYTDIKREKEKAEYELKKQTVDLAIELSTKALEEKVEESKQRELIKDFISKVGN